MCAEIKVGAEYEGKVISIKEFGAFIEIAPGRDGLCHISELDTGYVGRVDDVVQIGDKVKVKVIAIDDQGRVKLSRKALLPPGEGGGETGGERRCDRPPREDRGDRDRGRRRRPRRPRGDRGGDRGDRGDRGGDRGGGGGGGGGDRGPRRGDRD